MWYRKNDLPIYSKIKLSSTVMIAALLGLLLSNVTPAHDSEHDAIIVHGDWVVTVSNPDGSVAQEASFQNALVTPGLLVGLLVQESEWVNVTTQDTLWVNSAEPLTWYIDVATSGVDTSTCQTYLTVEYDQFGNGYERTAATASAISSSSFTLSRTLVLPLECVTGESYSISGVSTAFIAYAVAGGAVFPGHSKFTDKTLPAPIVGILPDQVVTLKATISFQ